jgi:hypothetical protein
MLLTAAVALAAFVSPVGIDVVTKDGVHRLVPFADADGLPAEVCAIDVDSVDAAAPVCGAVVADRTGARATVDVNDHGQLRFVVRAKRFDARMDSPAALAGGAALATALVGVTAVTCSVIAVAPSAPGAADTQGALGAVGVAMWGATAVGTVATGILAYATYTDANELH